MPSTPRDSNNVPAKMGVLCTDGVTLIPIAVDALGNMKVDQISTISFTPATIAPRDENFVPAWLGVSSVDNETPVPIYVNAEGAVLIDT